MANAPHHGVAVAVDLDPDLGADVAPSGGLSFLHPGHLIHARHARTSRSLPGHTLPRRGALELDNHSPIARQLSCQS